MRLVLTSLDGSLLDLEFNSYGAARQALAALERRSIPLVLYSLRTRAQLEHVRRQLRLEHPFICEDGSAVYVPEHYFPAGILDEQWQHRPPYYVYALGLPYSRLRSILQQVRQDFHLDLIGFGDWTASELAAATGIPLEEAERAQQREYSEIFSYSGDPETLREAFAQQEANLTQHLLRVRQLHFSSLPQWYLTGWMQPTMAAEPNWLPGNRRCSGCWIATNGIWALSKLWALGVPRQMWPFCDGRNKKWCFPAPLRIVSGVRPCLNGNWLSSRAQRGGMKWC